MKSASVLPLVPFGPVTKDTTMSSRTRRLLEAFEGDFRTAGDEAAAVDVDADDVDAAFSRKMGSGELTRDRLDAAFARRFPGRTTKPANAAELGAAFLSWLTNQKRTPQSVATEFGLPIRVVDELLKSARPFESTPPPELPPEFRSTVRRLLSAVAAQAGLKNEDGPVLRAARDTPLIPKK